jgi:acyl-CoA thioester hydrolase
VFSIPIRVYYEDTDAGGVVYYANYFKFMERARTEWLRSLGFGQAELARDPGVLFAVHSAKLEFLKPARFDDLLEATIEIRERGRASLTFGQLVRRGNDVLCEGEVRVACLEAKSFAPCSIPAAIFSRIDTGVTP